MVDKFFLFMLYRKHVQPRTTLFSSRKEEVMWNSCALMWNHWSLGRWSVQTAVCNTQRWSCKNQSSKEYLKDVILVRQIQIYAFFPRN